MENKLTNSFKLSSGFTLIELLIVIVLIGILASLVFLGMPSAIKKARDARRRSDLNQYRIALESYSANNNSQYPGYVGSGATLVGTLRVGFLSNFMSATILDPINTAPYIYYYFEDAAIGGATSASQYLLYGGLETGGYWEICGSDKAGKVTAAPADSVCDL